MSVELLGVLIAVAAVGATLTGLQLTGHRAIRTELVELRRELAAQRKDFGTELAAQRKDFGTELVTHRKDFSAELAMHRKELSGELSAQRKYFDERFTALEQHFAELRERMAHLEGLLDGLREAIAIQRGAA